VLLLQEGHAIINAAPLMTPGINERCISKMLFVVANLPAGLTLPGSCLARNHQVDFEEVLSAGDDGSACSF